DVSFLRRQRAKDRLQGRQAAAAFHLRTGQDRAKSHHRGLNQEATCARQRDKARALHGAASLCAELARPPCKSSCSNVSKNSARWAMKSASRTVSRETTFCRRRRRSVRPRQIANISRTRKRSSRRAI